MIKSPRASTFARRAAGLTAALALFGLSACGEKSQELGTAKAGSTVTRDTKAYDGDGGRFALNSFKRGDKTSWETHMRNRIQGQDEYSREK